MQITSSRSTTDRPEPKLATFDEADARLVLAAIQASPGLSNLDVSAATGLAPARVKAHIDRLVEAGLVRLERHGRDIRLNADAP